MIECNGCGRMINDECEYCPHCGTKRGDFLLMKYNKESQKENKRNRLLIISTIIIISAFILFITVIMLKPETNKEYLKLPKSGVASKAIIPDNCYGEVEYNSDDNAYITVRNISDEAFDSYISLLYDSGFNIDSEYYGSSYYAYNEEGYRINAYFYNDELNIDLYAPIKFSTINWPKSGLGALVPAPASNKLSLTNNANYYFSCYIADMDYSSFSDYCNACITAGFNLDYYLSDKYFYAENKDNVSLTISYEGFNTVLISISDNENTGN